MTVLMWDKPKKKLSKEEWAESYGFEDGPTGGYLPNMSKEDKLRWKAKITGKKLGFPQVEIRKTTENGSQILLIINLGDGYNYKYYKAVNPEAKSYEEYNEQYGPSSRFKIYPTQEELDKAYAKDKNPTKGINVHISTNGPIQMSFDELNDMNCAIEEAKVALAELV